MRKAVILVLLAVYFMLSCSKEEVDPNLTMLEVDFVWPKDQKCDDTVSPEIKISNVPANTKAWRIDVIDLVGHRHPGGGEVPYTGSGIIPFGSLTDYKSPCVEGWGSVGYELIAKALDGRGKTIGIGKKTKHWPPDD